MVFLPNLLCQIHPDDLHYPYNMTTNGELLDFANSMLRPHGSTAVEVFMGCDIFQCLVTFSVCLYTLAKKGRMRNLSLFSLRKSPCGTFIVPNAVVVFLVGVCIFLITWSGFCGYIIWVQKSDHPLFYWL